MLTNALHRAMPVFALALSLAGCAAYERAQIQDKEDLLAAAGFVQRPANTPARQAAMAQLPPQRFVRRVAGNDVTYLYADPIVCNCLYVGTQAAYGRYQQNALARRIAEDRLMAAQMEAQAAMDWSWGPWGGPGWW